VALVCGRYEGFDERIASLVDQELSLGDFVLSGGEPAAIAIVDAVARLHEGVLGNAESAVEESFEIGLLEYPQYTRPAEWRGLAVPEPLLSGDHERIRRWRRQQALLRTRARRPDLLTRHVLSDEDRELLGDAGGIPSRVGERTWVALVHHPVHDRERRVITTAITNLDVHDLARSTRSYGLAGCFVVTPVEAQRELATRILDGWREEEAETKRARRAASGDLRREALARVEVVASLEEAVAAVERSAGARPAIVGTSAQARDTPPTLGYAALDAWLGPRPLLILFGTGWGLAEPAWDRVDRVLAPIQGAAAYNHLSVRSAAAVTLDRLFGDRF
jgi:tRNA (guanine37-N1)-methyltransferase